jgi:hypothetical protein
MSADAMQFWSTFFRSYAATEKVECKVTMPALGARIRQESAPTKDQLPWLKLAFFGNKRTSKNSLRHDANVRWISGIEADYDGEKIPFDEAADLLDQAGIMSICYTSPSHMEDTPRWRVLAPFSLGQQSDQRPKFLARLNGLFGGVFSHESWTLSQSFYFGSVANNPSHRVEEIYGHTIDQLDDLDATAIGRAAGPRKAGGGHVAGTDAGQDARDDAELIRRIVTGEGLHVELCAVAARYIGRGLRPDTVVALLRGVMLATAEPSRDERWHHRFGQIPGLVDSAAAKYTDQADAWKAIARTTHRAHEAGHTYDATKTAVLQEAERSGIGIDTAIKLMQRILATKAGVANAA